MKRLHVHVSVKDLPASIHFYRTLFAAEPVVTKPDYAKWMLDDPRVNFAISMNRQPVGINHLGFQVESDEELRGMRAQLEAADARMVEENEQPCCYAKSDKYWVTDPTGIAWETFHTLGRIPVYGEDTAVFNHGAATVPQNQAAAGQACCVPAVLSLLQGAGLPTADLKSAQRLKVWVLEGSDSVLGGVIALERFGTDALLRSLAVAPEY